MAEKQEHQQKKPKANIGHRIRSAHLDKLKQVISLEKELFERELQRAVSKLFCEIKL